MQPVGKVESTFCLATKRNSMQTSADRCRFLQGAQERVTVDLNLKFTDPADGEAPVALNGLSIIEVKQEKFSRSSPIFKVLKEHRVYPYKISKYCIGMLASRENLKYNRFKKKILNLNKLLSGEPHGILRYTSI